MQTTKSTQFFACYDTQPGNKHHARLMTIKPQITTESVMRMTSVDDSRHQAWTSFTGFGNLATTLSNLNRFAEFFSPLQTKRNTCT